MTPTEPVDPIVEALDDVTAAADSQYLADLAAAVELEPVTIEDESSEDGYAQGDVDE